MTRNFAPEGVARRRVSKHRLPDMHNTPLFAVRAPRSVHARLRAAADADGLTMAAEIVRLLDLRDHYERVTRPRHPLSLPVPVPSRHV